MFLGLLSLHVVIYHGVALDDEFYSLLLFSLYLLPVVVLTFTHLLFVLVVYLLSILPVPAHYTTIQPGVSRHVTWHFYHAIELGYDFPLLLFCVRLKFTNILLSFLPPAMIM